MNIILFSIPIFFLLITAELIAEKVRKFSFCRLHFSVLTHRCSLPLALSI